MTTNYGKHISTKETPQSEKIPGSAQVPNSAGGFSFQVDDWTRLDRFLILGAEGGSYYARERELTISNAESVKRCIQEDGARTVARIVEISDKGRAPKNDPAIFALALALKFGDAKTKSAARYAVPLVCRIGTHIFQFAQALDSLGGWGPATRKAIAGWYLNQQTDQLALNVVKYQNRASWTHKDLLRKAHPVAKDAEHDRVLRWVTARSLDAREVKRKSQGGKVTTYKAYTGDLPRFIEGFEKMRQPGLDEKTAVKLIEEYSLPREVVPTELLNSKLIWETLLMHGKGMPLTAMIRNLGKMSSIGLLDPLSTGAKFVRERLANAEALKKARVHPVALLLALSTYGSGKGVKGSLTWEVNQKIVDALDEAFYKSFDFVEPTGKRHLLAIDISGSMSWPTSMVAGTPLFARDAAAAMAMVTMKTEPESFVTAFASSHGGWRNPPTPAMEFDGIMMADVSEKMRLDTVIKNVNSLPAGGTDCSLPMLFALHKKIPVDVFVVYTDSETWAGRTHPVQALKKYRDTMGINSKLVVVGMVSNGFTIADPSDPGMLDVVGFDTSVPTVMAEFAKGSV